VRSATCVPHLTRLIDARPYAGEPLVPFSVLVRCRRASGTLTARALNSRRKGAEKPRRIELNSMWHSLYELTIVGQ
jgi:hypothetical protein